MDDPTPQSRTRHPLSSLWAMLLIFVAVVIAYFPAITGGFIWDDNGHVTKPELRSGEGLVRIWTDVTATQQYYPVLHSVFWIEHRLWGDTAVGYHLCNILLHASVACFVALVLRRLSIPGAWLAAGVFALHPVHVESVAWITEQKNTVSALFYLGAALAYLRFDRARQFSFYLLALGLFVLGLLSKTVTATLPAALLVVFWWQRGRLEWRREIAPLIPFFVVGAIAGIFTASVERALIGAEGADFELPATARGLLAGRVIWFYLGKLFWPSNLMFVYPRWDLSTPTVSYYLFPIGIAALIAGLFIARHRSRAPLAGFLFFAGSLFPVLGFLNVYPFVFSFVADHFQYLASLGIIVPVTAGLFLLLTKTSSPPRWALYAFPAVVLGTLGALAWRQSRTYHDAETLYRTTIAKNPECWLACNNLGVELHATWRNLEAVPFFEQALRARPDQPGTENNLGVSLAAVGQYSDAIAHYERALQLRPDYAEAHHNLAVALANAGRAKEALPHYGQAQLCASFYPQVHADWGFILGQAGKYREAIVHCQKMLVLNPQRADAHDFWGIALANSGDLEGAIAHFEQALRIDPNDLQALTNLGKSFRSIGRNEDAIVVYEKILRVDPAFPDMLRNLGDALHALGRDQEAAARYNRARQLQQAAPEKGGNTKKP